MRRVNRIEDGHKRVRVYLGGEVVADTTRPLLVWERPYHPVYYFPEADVRADLLAETGETRRSPSRGDARSYTVEAGGKQADDAAYGYADSEELSGYLAFRWEAMDNWFEEDEEVFVHARDPYTRVDILRSSRHIEVAVDGVTVADSHHPTILFETGLPPRYYLPKVDIRMDLLDPAATVTRCPYKGTAEYWSVRAGGETYPDLAWSYRHPTSESAGIAGLVCFYNEKVDLAVDGRPQELASSAFS
ncbi:MAG: DUF427 domain-containing protein [Acidimicrobiia bacterium]